MGLDFDQALLHAVIPTELNQIENARRAAPRLLQGRKPPTAIIAGSDYLAIGLIKGFAEAGIIVPDQVSIVGFDNVLFAEYVSPSLTTVKQPKKEKGVRATQILIDAIECPDAKPESRILLPTSIVERQSVGFPQRPASPGEVGSARINPIMS
jgi:LacI family transcriptional regulator